MGLLVDNVIDVHHIIMVSVQEDVPVRYLSLWLLLIILVYIEVMSLNIVHGINLSDEYIDVPNPQLVGKPRKFLENSPKRPPKRWETFYPISIE